MNDSRSIASSAFGAARVSANMTGIQKRPQRFCVVNSVIDVVRPQTLPGGASGETAGSFNPGPSRARRG